MSQSAADANAITTQPLLSPMNNANVENKANTPVYPDEAASVVITTQPMLNDPTDEEQQKKKQQKLQKEQRKDHDDIEAAEAADDCIWCCFTSAHCLRDCECPSCDDCCDGGSGDCCTGCCDNGQSADVNVDGNDCADCLECCGTCFECCSSD